MRSCKRGFTLIELLVVIGIIGILSAVVLASLALSRNKGSAAAVKSNLASVRAQADIVYDEAAIAPNYAGVCTDATVVSYLNAASLAGSGDTTSDLCRSRQTDWAAAAPLKKDPATGAVTGVFCVDSTGAAKTTYGTGSNPYTRVTGAGTTVAITTGGYKCN